MLIVRIVLWFISPKFFYNRFVLIKTNVCYLALAMVVLGRAAAAPTLSSSLIRRIIVTDIVTKLKRNDTDLFNVTVYFFSSCK